MKRDFDLIRRILADIEVAPAGKWMDSLEYEGYDAATVGEHVRLLSEAKLILAKVTIPEDGDPYFRIFGLTWAGHDFMDVQARDGSLWSKAQETILKPGLGVTFDLLLEWLKAQAGATIGLP